MIWSDCWILLLSEFPLLGDRGTATCDISDLNLGCFLSQSLPPSFVSDFLCVSLCSFYANCQWMVSYWTNLPSIWAVVICVHIEGDPPEIRAWLKNPWNVYLLYQWVFNCSAKRHSLLLQGVSLETETLLCTDNCLWGLSRGHKVQMKLRSLKRWKVREKLCT